VVYVCHLKPEVVATRQLSRYTEAMSPSEIQKDRPLRADAEQNRERIVEAAQALFAERGIDVTREDIARRAGVGMATLRRRYPTRADLLAGAFEEKMWLFATGARKALKDPDPWHGFCRYVTSLCAMQTTDRGFSDVLSMTFPAAAKFEAARTQAYEDFSELMKRAKAAGALREDFVAEDLIILVMASAGVVAAAGKTAPRSAPRLVGYLLQAFAAPGVGPLPPPPSSRQIYKAVTRLNDEAN
jgi:AcrR family transcriptional regulator